MTDKDKKTKKSGEKSSKIQSARASLKLSWALRLGRVEKTHA